MHKQAGVALGAGLASSLLFVVSAKGTTAAALIAYFTTLPIMIAALGFGHVSGLTGAVLGAAGVALGLSPLLAAFFALCFALPGWWLAYLALLAQPAPGPQAAPGPQPAIAVPPPLVWYPVGRIVTWAAAIAIVAVLVLGGVAVLRYGGYDHAMTTLARRLDEAVEQAPNNAGTALVFVKILPLAMAASLFLMLGVNLWLAGRIAKFSDRLKRPWPDVPEGLRLPTGAAIVFLLAVGPALLGGPAGAVAGTIAAALGLAFALQGLATAHVLTRGFRSRGAILALIYVVTLAVPVAIAALSLIGLIDCLFSLRARRQPPSTPIPPQGV